MIYALFSAPTVFARIIANPIFQVPMVAIPNDIRTNALMLARWIHFLAGITWIGLLYFFNLVNAPAMKEMDAGTRSKVMPSLMSRAMWWFRWSALITVLAGLGYWGSIVGADAQNAAASSGHAIGTFFLVWTIAWALTYAVTIPSKGILAHWLVFTLLYVVIIVAACWAFLAWNHHGWESNRLLAIGLGGGFVWIMLLNVWGVVWRIQKRLILWTKENAANGAPVPEKSRNMARIAVLTSRASAILSIPLLFLMGAASHYPMFGR